MEINFILNGEKRSILKKTSIKNLLDKLDIKLNKVAIEINYEIININDIEKIFINDGDKVEIVHFIGGG